MGEGIFSGWGIRTLAAPEVRYNPMSYHNGSIWPHDNALAAAGMAHYWYTEQAVAVFASLFDASLLPQSGSRPQSRRSEPVFLRRVASGGSPPAGRPR